jgi:hypothetical protein
MGSGEWGVGIKHNSPLPITHPSSFYALLQRMESRLRSVRKTPIVAAET